MYVFERYFMERLIIGTRLGKRAHQVRNQTGKGKARTMIEPRTIFETGNPNDEFLSVTLCGNGDLLAKMKNGGRRIFHDLARDDALKLAHAIIKAVA